MTQPFDQAQLDRLADEHVRLHPHNPQQHSLDYLTPDGIHLEANVVIWSAVGPGLETFQGREHARLSSRRRSQVKTL
jgi:hypothetical protein